MRQVRTDHWARVRLSRGRKQSSRGRRGDCRPARSSESRPCKDPGLASGLCPYPGCVHPLRGVTRRRGMGMAAQPGRGTVGSDQRTSAVAGHGRQHRSGRQETLPGLRPLPRPALSSTDRTGAGPTGRMDLQHEIEEGSAGSRSAATPGGGGAPGPGGLRAVTARYGHVMGDVHVSGGVGEVNPARRRCARGRHPGIHLYALEGMPPSTLAIRLRGGGGDGGVSDALADGHGRTPRMVQRRPVGGSRQVAVGPPVLLVLFVASAAVIRGAGDGLRVIPPSLIAAAHPNQPGKPSRSQHQGPARGWMPVAGPGCGAAARPATAACRRAWERGPT